MLSFVIDVLHVFIINQIHGKRNVFAVERITMKHLKLSACWIVRNEQDDLQRSIDSVKGQVDEMIVVDTGSTDRTVEIAQRAGADVFHFDWIDDFSAPRNYAIEQATGDWIIFLDADEYFIEPEKVRRAVEKFAVKDAILIPRINIDPERGGREVSRDWNARIFRRAPNLRYRGLIHENIANLNGKLEYIFADARLATYHTGYSSARIESKLRRNLKLIELEIERDGHQVRHDIALVDCYYGLGDYERAIEHARRALTSEAGAVTGRGNLYHKMLDAMRALHYPDEQQLTVVDEAIRTLPQLPEFYAERGMILCGLNRLDEAYLEFHKSLEVWRRMPSTVHENSYFAAAVGKVYARLGEFELLVGNIVEARKNFGKAVELEPGNQEFKRRLAQLKG